MAALTLRGSWRAGLLAAVLAGPVQAQFNMVPAPLCRAPAPSRATDEAGYRLEAARHVYACFPMRVYHGPLPPLLFGIMTVDLEVDDKGALTHLAVVRKPAADIVEPWLVALLRRAAPFPVAARLEGGRARWTETFFVDKSGLFQTFSLTEGQR